MSKLSDRILYNEALNRPKAADSELHSILRNMQHILNNRSSIGIKKFLAEDTVLDNLTFGMPDFAFLSISSTQDQKILCEAIQKAIVAFEPRLKDVNIELGGYDALKREIIVKVSAYFNRDNLAVNFLLNLNHLEFIIDERERK